MAGGIDWYRAYHGTVADPKFGLVAKRAGQRRGDVVAMWHLLMEAASAATDRGNPGAPDFETIDDLLGMDEGAAELIFGSMVGKGLINSISGRLEAWDLRQPKREREEAPSTERVREFRAKQRQLELGNDEERHETDVKRQETPRVEKSREEEKDTDLGFAAFWSAYPCRKAKQDAAKAWSKLKPSPDLQASILEAVAAQRQGEDWLKEGGRFVPHASTWLNAKRWQDEAPRRASAFANEVAL